MDWKVALGILDFRFLIDDCKSGGDYTVLTDNGLGMIDSIHWFVTRGLQPKMFFTQRGKLVCFDRGRLLLPLNFKHLSRRLLLRGLNGSGFVHQGFPTNYHPANPIS